MNTWRSRDWFEINGWLITSALQTPSCNRETGELNVAPASMAIITHEYCHGFGLPDLYDYTGENSTGFWTLMSSGSWLSQGNEDIGSQPNHLGVWEKFQLGWLNYEVAFAGEKSEHKLGPAETNTKQAQGLFGHACVCVIHDDDRSVNKYLPLFVPSISTSTRSVHLTKVSIMSCFHDFDPQS